MESAWIDLLPFARTDALGPYAVRASLGRASEGLHLRFRVEARDPEAFGGVALAGKTAVPARRDELWKTTCFEAFLGVKDSPGYFELNLSPSGDWAWYRFAGYRTGMTAPALADGAAPRELSRLRKENALEATWLLPNAALAGAEIESASLSAVLDAPDGISYWAARHAGREADFHLRASFTRLNPL